MTENDPMPVFPLQAEDLLATEAIRRYYDACLENGLTEQAAEVMKAWTEFRAWQDRHRDRMKLPDHTHVPARPS